MHSPPSPRHGLGPLALALLLVLFGLAPQPVWAAAGGQELLLLYSNNVQGETEPCGCQPNQFGGLARKAFQFRRLTDEAKLPHLTLDAGNLLFKEESIAPGQSEQEGMAAATIVAAYNLIGYDAVGIGSRDLAGGVELLKSLSHQARFAWLSANLVDATSHKPLFAVSLRLKVGEAMATVIGLTGPTKLPAADKATILDWEAVLPNLLADRAQKTDDLVILLSDLPAADNQRIAENYPAVHLILQSRAEAGIGDQPTNNTLLAATKPLGREIGILNITWQPSKRWGCPPAELLAKRQAALDGVLWQVGKYRKGDQDPEQALRDQPERLAGYRALLAKEKELRAEIDRMRSCLPSEHQAESEPSSYSNRFLTIDTSLPEQTEVAKLGLRLDRDLNDLGRRQAKAGTEADSDYLGSEACGPCHAAQLTAWRKTKHAGAYGTLADKSQQYNLNCLPCHVTGVGLHQAPQALSLPESRREVGCEACHGPGRRHRQSPTANRLVRRPGPEVCHTCHAPPHDETFDYEQNSKLVH